MRVTPRRSGAPGRVTVTVGLLAVLGGALVAALGLTGRGTPPTPVTATPVAAFEPERAPALAGPPANLPGADDFYRAPAPVDRVGDGGLLRYRGAAVPATDPGTGLGLPVRAWQVLYRSTTVADAPTPVSGSVLVPEAPWGGPGPRPVVGYAMGTHGLDDRCAPSYFLATGSEEGMNLVGRLLARGWAVAITDYEGLGTPGEHTYLVHRAEGRAVLDVLRAAVRLPGAGLLPDAPVGLWGYSQGGGAVAAAAEQVAGYAPELKLLGAAAGGVPADLAAMAGRLDGTRYFGLVAAGVAGLGAAYPDLGLPGSLTEPGRRLYEFARGMCSLDFFDRRIARHRLPELLPGADPLRTGPLGARLAQNRVGTRTPTVPLRLYQGLRDEFIPAAMSRALAAGYCAGGATVQFQTYPGRNHGGAAAVDADATVGWLADRFVGRPAPNTC